MCILLGHQVIDGGELQDRIALEWLFEEALGHRGRAQQQRAHIQPHDGGRQQSGRREHGEAPADVFRDRQDRRIVAMSVRLEQVAQLARRRR